MNRFNNNISLDRILLSDSLITNPTEIKSAIQQHFQTYFQQQPLPPINSTSEFYNLYKPNSHLEQHYTHLLSEISMDEWNNMITKLSNQKAAGPSGINYEHIKNSSQKTQNIFRLFLSKCFHLQQTPSD